MTLNTRSLLNRIYELEYSLLVHDPDVAVLTKTWLHAGISYDVIQPRYIILREEKGARCEGVALLIKTVIARTASGEAEDNKSVFCEINIDGIAIIVGALYRPPNAPH